MFLLFVREQNFSDEAQQKSNPAGRIALAPVRGAAARDRGLYSYTLQFYEPSHTPGYTGTPPHTCGTGHRWIMLVVIIMGRARGVCPCSFCTGGARRLAFG